MKLYTLSADTEYPCFVLTHNQTHIMLDCAINLRSLSHFLPHTLVKCDRLDALPNWHPQAAASALPEANVFKQFKECSGQVFLDAQVEFHMPDVGMIGDVSALDAILISNYHNFLALPFITEYCGYDGRIYCTEPTLEFGGQFLMEIAHYLERSPKQGLDNAWTDFNFVQYLPKALATSYHPGSWRGFYSKKDIESCLRKVQRAEFNEKIELFGLMNVTAVCSGYSLGSCNWIVESDYEKIVYLSFSSSLEFRCKSIDVSPLAECDAAIVTALCGSQNGNPSTVISEIGSIIVSTLKEGGNVLIPCFSAGVIFDLFESVVHFLDEGSLPSTPIYYISPVSDQMLAFSNIFAEWASAERQSRVYLPEEPFIHGQLVKSGRLKHYNSISDIGLNDFKEPCLVFCGHASLRFGDSVHFMELWGKSEVNTLILVEPSVAYPEVIAPYQPLAMKVAHRPLDLRLTVSKVQKLVSESLKPKYIICPVEHSGDPSLGAAAGREEPVLRGSGDEHQLLTYRPSDVLDIPIKSRWKKVVVDAELVDKLELQAVTPDLSVCRVVGEVSVADNKVRLGAVSDTDKHLVAYKPHYPYGQVDINKFVAALERQGFLNVRLNKTDAGAAAGTQGQAHTVNLDDIDTFIQIEPNNTHIFCEAGEPVRKKLYLTLLDCLKQLY